MPDDVPFKRRLVVVALLHVIFLGGFFVASQWTREPPRKDVIAWIDGPIDGGETPGESDLRPASVESSPAPPVPTPPEPMPPPAPELIPEPPPPPVEPPLPSEIVTSTPPPATPRPETPRPATPKPATPKPATPKPATPKPKPTAKPTPKHTPKPKASPPPDGDDEEKPKPRTTPSEKPKGTPSDKPKATPGAAKGGGSDATKQAFHATKSGGNGPGTGNGKGPAKSGDGEGLTKYGWYFAMLKDRFTARWAQPTNIDRSGADIAATLKVRISKDGVISEREIVQSSGFPQMDESVLRAAEKVTQIDPLPAGLGNGEFFDVNVQFKLDQAP